VVRWRKDHPKDLITQRYMGSTAASADWQAIVRGILGEMKRAFGIAEEIPRQVDALNQFSGGVRFCWEQVRRGRSWEDMQQCEEAMREKGGRTLR
jgi:hypothetical protein